MKKFSLTYFFFLISFTIFSQKILKESEYNIFSVDIHLGIPVFYGDISNRFGYVLSSKLNWHMTSAFALNTEITFGELNGSSKNNKNIFKNSIFKLSLSGEAYLLNLLQFKRISKIFQPYIGIGLGGLKSNIIASKITDISQKEKYKGWTFLFQFSGGFKFKLSNRVDLNFRTIINLPKSDYLDNYNPKVFANKHNDTYNEFLIGITYYLGQQIKSPLAWKTENTNNITDSFFKKKETQEDKNIPIDVLLEEEDKNETFSKDLYNNELDCQIKF